MATRRRNAMGQGATKARKDRVVHVRFSASELTDIGGAASRAGLTLSAFMRSLTLDGAGVLPFFSDDDRAILDLLLVEMREIGVNLNRVARIANHGSKIDATVSQPLRETQKVVAAVMVELRSYAARRGRRREGTA